MADDLPVSEGFIEYLKSQEKFASDPYPDAHGFSIGFGHFRKAKSAAEAKRLFKAPWDESKANDVLRADVREHYRRAASYVAQTHGDDAWNSLSQFEQEALTDFAFNPGLKKFPKLTKAIIDRDRLRIAKEFRRYSGGEELQRNKAWWAKYGKKITGIKYRNTNSVKRLVEFLDDIGVYTGDL